MAICLGINDDLIKLFIRYDDLKAHKKPQGFVSCFHTEYAAYNLNYQKKEEDVKDDCISAQIANQMSNLKIDSENNIPVPIPVVSNNNIPPKGNENLISFDSEQVKSEEIPKQEKKVEEMKTALGMAKSTNPRHHCQH